MHTDPFEVGFFLCWCWAEQSENGKWVPVARFARKSDHARPQQAYYRHDLESEFDSDEAARKAARDFAIRQAHADAIGI